MKLKCWFAIAILYGAASVAWCDEAGKTAKVEEFFRLTKMDELLRQSLAIATDQVKSGIIRQLMGGKASPEMEKKMGAFQDKVAVVVSNALSWDRLKSAYLKLYADAFSEEELDGIIGFYKSPAGQAMVAKTPSLMQKATVVAQEKMGEAQPELKKLIEEFVAETQKKN
jgi:uncharacterized protein